MRVDFVQAVGKAMAAYGVQVLDVAPPYAGLERFDYGLRKTLDPQFEWDAFGDLLRQEVPAKTLVLAEDVFGLHFAFLHLPGSKGGLLIVGPWATGPRAEKSILWAQRHLLPASCKALEEFYNAVPVAEGQALPTQLQGLAALLYPQTLQSVTWHEFRPLNFRPDLRFFAEPDFEQELPAAMIERRYEAENRVLDAVALGDTAAALMALDQLKKFRLVPRQPNPLREGKDLLIIINTLLRKAIERASVHPYYIDRISTKHALAIEALTTTAALSPYTETMVQEYCAYVRRYSLRSYSPLVQKVINHINLNMDSQLSLKSLAAMCYISPSYLSNLFKQETGQTLTDYINTQRIRRAAHRLCTTGESVAIVAEQVGILDVNYFTKIFKKIMGATPTQYRRQHREQ